MSKGKIIGGLLAVALICGACDKDASEKKTKGPSSTPTTETKIVGVATVTHTKYAETNYGLPSWEWTKADIYTYENGWNNVRFYVQDKDEPIESNWYPVQ